MGLEPTTFELEVQCASPLRHGGILVHYKRKFYKTFQFYIITYQNVVHFRWDSNPQPFNKKSNALVRCATEVSSIIAKGSFLYFSNCIIFFIKTKFTSGGTQPNNFELEVQWASPLRHGGILVHYKR